jgi:nitroimidazol reductase NimA-like FMN-containing flavoprotein (pyridoxamine 5'-phosphate oxidase superfamily)
MTASLSRLQCLQLLGTVTVGRVIVHRHALPVVRPVQFRLVNEAIVMAVLPGGRVAMAATRGDIVAFEADCVDSTYGAGWSVVVTGVLEPSGHHSDDPAAGAPWAPKGRTTVLHLPTSDVIGRMGSVVWA